jgi:uncharacterized protein
LFNGKFALFFLIIFIAKAVETVTGFGSTIIALTLGAQLYQIEFLLPIVVPLNIVLSTYIVVRHARAINWPELARWILPYTIGGLIVGMIIFDAVQGNALKLAYGIFVICFAVIELVRLLRTVADCEARPLSTVKSIIWLFAGGVIHGIYASGGPMVVYYSCRKITDKSIFRSTLSVLWLVLNLILLGGYIRMGKMTVTSLKMFGALLPALIVGLAVGDILHKRIPERKFRVLVYVLLIIAGASLIYSNRELVFHYLHKIM